MAEKTFQNSSGGSKKTSGSTTKPAAAAQKSAAKVDDFPKQPCRNCKRRIVINLVTHVLHAYETDKDGKAIERFTFEFVDGRNPHYYVDKKTLEIQGIEIHCTPTDKTKISRKEGKNYRSKKYNAPMPYAIFFTDRGEAIHEGNISRRAEHMAQADPKKDYSSHGCIRIAPQDAKALHCWTQVGDLVELIGHTPSDKAKNNKKDKQAHSTQGTGGIAIQKPEKLYKVKYGDTVYSIAKQSGTTAEQIQKVNPNIKNGFIRVGDTIVMPE